MSNAARLERLQKLAEFANSFGSKNKSSKRRNDNLDVNTAADPDEDDIDVRDNSRKIKKKKASSANLSKTRKHDGNSKHLGEIRCALGLDEMLNKRLKKSDELLVATSEQKMVMKSVVAQKQNIPIEVVVFDDGVSSVKSRNSYKHDQQQEQKNSPNIKTSQSPEFDISRARYEIKRFGITGLGDMEKAEAQAQLAIRLGAKPEKKSCLNYKVLQADNLEKKRLKEESKAASSHYRNLNPAPISLRNGASKFNADENKTKSKAKKSISRSSMNGKYKSGVQHISKQTIKEVKKRSARGDRKSIKK